MIVVVGESLVDVVEDPGHPEHERETVGGSPLNVATTLAGLDVPTMLITEVGHDDRGRRIVEWVEASGAELIAAPSRTGRTATATVRLDAGEASYDFDIGWSLQHQELPHCDALHVGSLGTVLEPGRNSVLDLVDQAWARDVFVSYDPNVRAPLVGDPVQAWADVEALAARAQLVKLSDQDAAVLQPGADAEDIARSLLQGERTELVLLTRGSEGAVGFAGDLVVRVPAAEVRVADTVGAGDAFMAATLAVLFEGSAFGSYGAGVPADEPRLERILRAAVEVAGITCSRPGAAAPTRPELRPDWPA
ncbi:MAG TPA: carbohydrate kinase [Marmoricola sp.]|nr:carbohydrate kinase [Marmoricola sp.]